MRLVRVVAPDLLMVLSGRTRQKPLLVALSAFGGWTYGEFPVGIFIPKALTRCLVPGH